MAVHVHVGVYVEGFTKEQCTSAAQAGGAGWMARPDGHMLALTDSVALPPWLAESLWLASDRTSARLTSDRMSVWGATA